MDTIAELLAGPGQRRPPRHGGRGRGVDLAPSRGEPARRRAAFLAERRAPGPFHVATLLDNVPEHVLWLGAAALAGAVVVGGNSTHRGADLARDLAHTECQLLVTDRAHLPLVDGLDLGSGHRHGVGAEPPRRRGRRPFLPARRARTARRCRPAGPDASAGRRGRPRLPDLHLRAPPVPPRRVDAPRAAWPASG